MHCFWLFCVALLSVCCIVEFMLRHCVCVMLHASKCVACVVFVVVFSVAMGCNVAKVLICLCVLYSFVCCFVAMF